MADVQRERGYVQIANRLLEAILAADFTGTQLRIVLAILRLSYGWRQKTVRISHEELAGCASVAYGGSFRRALDHLLREGVVRILEPGSAGHASVFAIQKNFEEWGSFSVAQNRLVSLWGEQPDSADQLLMLLPEGVPTGTGEGVPLGTDKKMVPPAPPVPIGTGSPALWGQEVPPYRGITGPGNSRDFADLEGPKERKERKDKPPQQNGGGDLAEAYELFAKIESLAEQSQGPATGAVTYIRTARVRELLGEIVATAFENLGGGTRVLDRSAKASPRGVLVRDFAKCLTRARQAVPA